MANRQDSAPFSISFLMKSRDTGSVTPQMMAPPPCFLDGSLTSILSHDLPRNPEISDGRATTLTPQHENSTSSVDATRVENEDIKDSEKGILSPPVTPSPMTTVTTATQEPQTRLSPPFGQVLTYTDLSHQKLHPVLGRSDHCPPYTLEFLLGTGSPPVSGHQGLFSAVHTRTTGSPDTSLSMWNRQSHQTSSVAGNTGSIGRLDTSISVQQSHPTSFSAINKRCTANQNTGTTIAGQQTQQNSSAGVNTSSTEINCMSTSFSSHQGYNTSHTSGYKISSTENPNTSMSDKQSPQTSVGGNTRSTESPGTSTSDTPSTIHMTKTPASRKTSKLRAPPVTPKNCAVTSVTSPEEGSRSKRNRTNYSPNQIRKLEKAFQTTPYPDVQLYDTLSEDIRVPQKNLKTWFQNKRARSKRQRLSEGRMADKKPTASPYSVSPYPVPMSSALPPYPYVMSGAIMPPPVLATTSPSAMITPPPSPGTPHLVKQPVARYHPSVLLPMRPAISPPSGTPLGSSISRASHLHKQLSPPIVSPDTSWHSLTASYTGLGHDRLSIAEFRDLHDSAAQDNMHPVYPSMLSAIEKLCSSLPFN